MIQREKQPRVTRRVLLKAFGSLALLGAAGAALSACGSRPTGEIPPPSLQPTSATPGQSATPTSTAKSDVNVWHSWGVKQAEPIVMLTKEFNEKSATVNTILTYVPGTQLTQKILAAISAGNPPETVSGTATNLASYASANGIKDLAQLARAGEIDKQDIYPGPYEVIRYQGRIVAVPLTVGTEGYYLNEDLWKAAGLDVANPPRTWDDLVASARALTRPADKQWGWLLQNDGTNNTSQHWVSYLRQNGGDVLRADTRRATFNGPEGVEALQLWVDLVNRHKVSPQASESSTQITEAFGTGKVGMFQEYPLILGQIREYPFAIRTAPLTKKVTTGNLLGGWYFPIFTNSKNPDAGWTFLKWLFEPANQYRLNVGMGNLPTKKSTAQYSEYQAFLKQDHQTQAFIDQLPFSRPWPSEPSMPEITTLLGQAIQTALYLQATPKQALDDAAQKTDVLLQQKVP